MVDTAGEDGSIGADMSLGNLWSKGILKYTKEQKKQIDEGQRDYVRVQLKQIKAKIKEEH